jgi:hypothetical protein
VSELQNKLPTHLLRRPAIFPQQREQSKSQACANFIIPPTA